VATVVLEPAQEKTPLGIVVIENGDLWQIQKAVEFAREG
jgi:hypothetical protein